MKTRTSPTPTNGSRGGRALLVLAVVLGLALLGAGYWIGSASEPESPEPVLARRSTPAEQEPTRPSPAVAVPAESERLTVPASEEEPLDAATVRTETPEVGSPARSPQAENQRMLDAEERAERLRILRRGEDPEERLALARQILEEEPQSMYMLHALQTLAELDPTAAAEEVRKRIAQGDDPRTRGMMSTVISMLGANEAALSSADLTGFYDIGNKDVQLAAARALATRGDTSLTDRFRSECTDELASDNASVRADAVRHLAATRQPGTNTLLLPMLSDPDEQVRMQALRSVGQSGRDEATLEAIRGCLQDPSDKVRRAAERMVASMERTLELRRR